MPSAGNVGVRPLGRMILEMTLDCPLGLLSDACYDIIRSGERFAPDPATVRHAAAVAAWRAIEKNEGDGSAPPKDRPADVDYWIAQARAVEGMPYVDPPGTVRGFAPELDADEQNARRERFYSAERHAAQFGGSADKIYDEWIHARERGEGGIVTAGDPAMLQRVHDVARRIQRQIDEEERDDERSTEHP